MELSKENIKKRIAELKSVKDILFYLDVIEKEIEDRIKELYYKTRMDEYGDFLHSENGLEYVFEGREFHPDFMMRPPLTEKEQKEYCLMYEKEIREAEYLHNIEYFIKDQKKFYEKLLIKYSLMEGSEKSNEGSKSNSGMNELNRIDISEPKEFEKMLDKYYDYGKDSYLATWKDRYQIIAFEKKMIEKFGQEVSGYIIYLYDYISKRTNPIEFIDCDYEKLRKNNDDEKIKSEISRVEGYISEIEKLAYLTNDEKNRENIPKDALEKLEEWQCYYIDKIKDKELAEWINILRKNRPGVTDYKYGEFYPVEFKRVTEFALTEFNNYRDKLENLQSSVEGRTKRKRKKINVSNEIIADEVIKHWDNGMEEFEEIYKTVSDCSEQVFGIKLTKDQIKGRYQRYAEKNKEYKREKY